MTDQITPVVATAEAHAEAIRTVRLPRLNPTQLADAQKLAPTLKPGTKTIYGAVSLARAEKARIALSEISRDLLKGATLDDMKRASMLSDETLQVIKDLKVEDLSPEPKSKKGWLGTTLENAGDILKRIQEFFKRYQQINTVIDRVIVKAENEQAAHTVTHEQLLVMYAANWDLFHDLRVSFAAVKLFLDSPDGYAERDRRNAAAKAEVAAAEKENRDPDQVAIQAAQDYQSYIERVEMYSSTLSGAIVDAYQKSVAINMLGNNELIIVQGLDSLAKSVIPGWRDMLALGWAAFKAHGAVEFMNQLRETDNSIRLAKARMIGQAAAQMAALKKQTTYDPESMKVLNEALIAALEQLKTASEEGHKIREAAEQTNTELVMALSKVVANTAVDAD